MRIEKFVQDFANQFDETEMSEFKADTVFQELEEWSSLTAMSVIAFIKTEYGKSVTGKEIRSCGTIEDLFNLLLSK
ncbi:MULTISPECIES: acyl carrier protein [Bacteroides]|jgi:acyl carrier protein|uniref:Acyl carrier protein n=2 Tax=Bacteroides TaxID=816 RepID=A0A4S2AUM0_9BACE|nr:MULTISPECIES: acyl carrier protein [Bacteroides]NVK92508.1 acyl carrier protein [Bacteroides sp. L10-4]TGY04933.1 acyl carrier protein [Bacteroides muris (ex Afrizal et al. 2022)]